MEVVPVEHDAEVRHRDVVTVDRVVMVGRTRRGEVSDDLMAEQVEVDPLVARATFGAAEQFAIEPARGGEVVDREGEVEGGERGHRTSIRRLRLADASPATPADGDRLQTPRQSSDATLILLPRRACAGAEPEDLTRMRRAGAARLLPGSCAVVARADARPLRRTLGVTPLVLVGAGDLPTQPRWFRRDRRPRAGRPARAPAALRPPADVGAAGAGDAGAARRPAGVRRGRRPT
jgi:hypothetical protein